MWWHIAILVKVLIQKCERCQAQITVSLHFFGWLHVLYLILGIQKKGGGNFVIDKALNMGQSYNDFII